MYARMVWGHLRPSRWEDYESYYREKVFPYNDKIDGLVGRSILRGIDGEDEAVSLSIWDTEDDLHRYEASNLRKQFADDIHTSFTTSWSYINGEYWVKTFQIVDITRIQ